MTETFGDPYTVFFPPAESKAFAEEIAGNFEGRLTVMGRLVIKGTGRVKGTVRYASLVVEQGGQLSGAVELAEAEPAKAASSAPPLLGLAAGSGAEGGA